jgi:hypothetical protein
MRRKLLVWGLGGIAVFVAVVGVAVFVLFRDTATPVDRDDVVGDVGEIAAGENPGDPGLYVYETVGFETIDALGGARHDYPAETFLTIRSEGCGFKVRWQALEEHWSERTICEDGRLEVIDSYHEWFGIPEQSTWICEENARMLPVGDETEWSFTCEKEDDSVQTWEYRLVGTETVTVGGEDVETLHLHVVETISGRTNGGSDSHNWVLPGTPLIVKRINDGTNVSGSRVGDVTYHEEVELLLTSVVPLP